MLDITNQNIYLIGMMGSWKSTVGKQLAKIINLDFIDIDDQIEEMMNMNISDIFTKFGEKRFREMESAYFSEICKQKGKIFSTGGGIILDFKNREILQDTGITIFLDTSISVLVNRIRNTKKRPLLNNSQDLQKTLENIWFDRKHFYKDCAKYTVNTNDLKPNQVTNNIIKILGITVEEN